MYLLLYSNLLWLGNDLASMQSLHLTLPVFLLVLWACCNLWRTCKTCGKLCMSLMKSVISRHTVTNSGHITAFNLFILNFEASLTPDYFLCLFIFLAFVRSFVFNINYSSVSLPHPNPNPSLHRWHAPELCVWLCLSTNRLIQRIIHVAWP